MQIHSLGWEDPLKEGMAIHSSILTRRIPMDRGAWRATVHGVPKSQTRLSNRLGQYSVCMSIPISQFILPYFPPGNHKFVSYIWDSISVL